MAAFSQNSFVRAFALGVTFVCSCGADGLEYAHQEPGTFLNDQEGFTVRPNGKKSLVAAMRKDNKEIRVEALWRPIRLSLMKTTAWCTRVVDQDNHQPLISCANEPKEWSKEWVAGSSFIPREEDKRRAELGREMYEIMKKYEPPQGREEAWGNLLYATRQFMEAVYDPDVGYGPPPVFHDDIGQKKLPQMRSLIEKESRPVSSGEDLEDADPSWQFGSAEVRRSTDMGGPG